MIKKTIHEGAFWVLYDPVENMYFRRVDAELNFQLLMEADVNYACRYNSQNQAYLTRKYLIKDCPDREAEKAARLEIKLVEVTFVMVD